MNKPNKVALLPSTAKKVFDGVLFDVYQWDQPMFDGSTALFERITRIDTVIIFPVVNDHLLINKEEQPHSGARINVPAGRIDVGDKTIEEAAFRELKEETGIIPEKMYYVSTEQTDGKILWYINIFLSFGIKNRVEKSEDSGEKIENIEITFDQAYEMFKKLELELPKDLLKVLINSSKEEFLDRFKSPGNYFKEVSDSATTI